MDLATFLEKTNNLTIDLDTPSRKMTERLLRNEALFQLPFLAMSILFISKGRVKPSITEICHKLGEAFERSFVAFKCSNQHLSWSTNMRIRTTTAISFLEISNLITVDKYSKEISITELGKDVVKRVISEESNLNNNIVVISKNFNGIKKEDKIKGLFE